MSREIKFRAWNGEEMITLENSGLQYFDFEGSYSLGFTVDAYNGFYAHEQYEVSTKKASKFPIMQYTGLKDKNGVEIYEGDIIAGCNGSINGRDWSMPPMAIKWNNEKAEFNVPLWGTQDRQDSTHWFEIIGNIHQNPELLESK